MWQQAPKIAELEEKLAVQLKLAEEKEKELAEQKRLVVRLNNMMTEWLQDEREIEEKEAGRREEQERWREQAELKKTREWEARIAQLVKENAELRLLAKAQVTVGVPGVAQQAKLEKSKSSITFPGW